MTEVPFALPTLHVGALNRAEFVRYVADLRAAADDVLVLIRRGPHSTEECELAALDDLLDAIAAHVAIGAQVLYSFDGRQFRDVLMPLGASLRIVRMQVDDVGPARGGALPDRPPRTIQ